MNDNFSKILECKVKLVHMTTFIQFLSAKNKKKEIHKVSTISIILYLGTSRFNLESDNIHYGITYVIGHWTTSEQPSPRQRSAGETPPLIRNDECSGGSQSRLRCWPLIFNCTLINFDASVNIIITVM